MSKFTDASLVVVPSLHKAGKLYAVKPGTGLADFAVTRSTVKWVLGPNGVLRSVPANTPALEYNTDRTFRGMLVEPAATNIFQRSAEFDNAYWSKVNMGVTQNAGVAPDGTTTADRLVPNTTNAQHRVERVTTSTNAVHAYSIFAKADGYNFLSLRMAISGGDRGAVFNLSTGTVGTTDTGIETMIQPFPNGWYRIRISATANLNGTMRMNVQSTGVIATDWVADGTSGVLIWGAQLETGSVATSYIPTTASTANRTADSITLASAASLIGQTSGTAFVEFEPRINGVSTRILTLDDGSSTNNFRIAHLNTSGVFYAVTVGGVGQATITSAGTYTGVIKASFAYATNDFVAYVNGASIGTDASGALPATSRIIIGYSGSGTDYLNGWIRSVALFPERFPNAELATLTTL